jgi:hypothetical protein
LQKGGVAPDVHLLGALSHCLSSVQHPILNGVDFTCRLTREKAERLIQVGPSSAAVKNGLPDATIPVAAWKFPEGTVYDFHIKDLFLLIRRPLISERLFTKHQKLLASGHSAKYYLMRTSCNWGSCPTNVRTYLSPELFNTGALPSKLFITFFSQKRLQGSYSDNIQCYKKPENLQAIALQLDSRTIANFITPTTQTCDTGLLDFLYLGLYSTTQTYYSSHGGPNITRAEFEKHAFILAYDLTTASVTMDDSLPLLMSGSLRLKMDFSSPTVEAINVLSFAIHPSMMSIDKDRMVSLSYRN